MVPNVLKKIFKLLFALFLLLQEITHVGLLLLHLGVEVYLFIAIAELEILTWYEAPSFPLCLIRSGRITMLRFVVMGLFIAFTLPIMELLGNLLYLLGGEPDIFLFKWLSLLAQVDKQHFVLTVAEMYHLIVLLNGMAFWLLFT